MLIYINNVWPIYNTLRAVLDPHTMLGLVCYFSISSVSTGLVNCPWFQEIRFDLPAFTPVSPSKGWHMLYATEHILSSSGEFGSSFEKYS